MTPVRNTSNDHNTSVTEPGSTRCIIQMAMPSISTPNAAFTVFIHGPTRGSSCPADAPTTSKGEPMPMLNANSALEPRATSPV